MPPGRIISGVPPGYVPPLSAGSGIPIGATVLQKELQRSRRTLRASALNLMDAWLVEQQLFNSEPRAAGQNGYSSLFNTFPSGNRLAENGFSPLDIPGLQSWFAADRQIFKDAGTTPPANDDTVEQWNDLSGNWNATATDKPTYKTNVVNGLPAVLFNGTSNYMTLGTSPTIMADNASDSCSFFFVGYSTDATLTRQMLFSRDDNALGRWGNFRVSPTGGTNRISMELSGQTQTVEGATALPTNAARQIDWQVTAEPNAGDLDFFLSGSSDANGSCNNYSGQAATGAVYIGGRSYAANLDPWKGYVCEILFFQGRLSSEDAALVRDYLKAKWGTP